MNRELLELTVLVNSYDPRVGNIDRVNNKGTRILDAGKKTWETTEKILDANLPITEEYKNRIRAYYGELGRVARRNHEELYNRIMNHPVDDAYYFRIREELLTKYRFAKDFLDRQNAGINEVQQLAVAQAAEEEVAQQVQQVEADIAVQVAEAENEPIVGLTPFEALSDDLQELYINRGYNQVLRDEIDAYFRAATQDIILEFIRFARNSSRPVTLEKFFSRKNVQVQPVNEEAVADVAGMFDQAQIDADIAAENAAVVPDMPGDQQDPVVDAPVDVPGLEQPSNVEGTADNKVLYKERYHETSLELYFQNSSAPQWDPVLESGIMGLKISKEERIMMMDSVIKEFGAKIFVMERKSDTLEELNELVQLQFCILRNLHLGARARTATVRLSDLENLQRAANNAPNNATIKNSLSTEPVPINQTRQEASFIKNYDRLQHLNNLKGSNYYPQSKHDGHIKSKNDPHTIGLLTGNNIESVKKDVIKRIVPKNRLVRTSKN